MSQIIRDRMTLKELDKLAANFFETMIKGVVDVEREIIAVDTQLHSDLESLLLQNGSKQQNLWGINLYPKETGESFLEFDSMINVRPARGNRSRGVESPAIRQKIEQVIARRVVP